MNRHEHLYRWTGWALIAVLALWITAMLLALALPARLWKTGQASLIFFQVLFPILFVAAVVLGVTRMVSYIRWTGKYPYYFLFGKPHGPRNTEAKGHEGEPCAQRKGQQNGAENLDTASLQFLTADPPPGE